MPPYAYSPDHSRVGSSDTTGFGPRLADAFLRRGLLIRPLGNVVYFMPPYAISDAEAAWALATIGEVIEETAGGW